MSLDFAESVVLVTSSDSERKDFGTGFVIFSDEPKTYLLTCAHVVRDVGGAEKVKADGIPAKVIASGENNSVDLAVLQVEGLLDKPKLNVCVTGEKTKKIYILGFYRFDSKSPPALRKIHGKLGERIKLASSSGRERITAWDLKIDGEHYLQPGYSGSPVIDITSNSVLGIVSHQIGKGEKGLAISLEALEKIWLEMPTTLFESQLQEQRGQLRSQKIAIESEIELVEKKRNLIGDQIEKGSRFRDAAKWLNNNKKTLAERACQSALKNSKDLPINLISQKNNRFYREIERHLELVHGSLITESYDLLYEPRLRRSLKDISVYQTALVNIEQRVPEDLNGGKELIKRIQYLSKRLL